jgi:hypothetical protein
MADRAQPATCRMCRYWVRLRAGAIIGLCRNGNTVKQYPRSSDACSHWEKHPRGGDRMDESAMQFMLDRRPGRPRKHPR